MLSHLTSFLFAGLQSIAFTIAGLFVLAVILNKYLGSMRRPAHVQGKTSKQFEPVLKAFRDNLRIGWERDGAAFAVYHNGELVLDIWGGYADRDSSRLWREDTMNIAFSSSKAMGALCIAVLVDRGLLSFSDKVASFWPKFGKNGKEEITVEMIMSHTAGLAHFDRQITMDDARDHTRMAALIEDQTPNWQPGSHVGYHALTYGWLVDQIIRRVDPKQRSIGQFFKEEIADPHDIDFFIGLPLSQSYRVARLSRPSLWDRLCEFLTDPSNVDYAYVLRSVITSGLMVKVGSNPEWLQSVFRMPLNNPDLYPLEQCAVSGIGTARAMAKLFNLVLSGKIISLKTLDYLCEPVVSEEWKDIVTGAHVARGHGLTHLFFSDRAGNRRLLLGHAGLGGQNIRLDRHNNISFAYLSNGLKGGLGDRARTYVRIIDALYKCLPVDAASSSPSVPSIFTPTNDRKMEVVEGVSPIPVAH